MGRSVSLYTSAAIEPAELVRFVAGAGGEILDEEGLDAHFSAGAAHVWIYGARAALAGVFEAPSEAVAEKLGDPVMVRLDLQLSHHEESGPLALEVAARFVRTWPAVVSLAADRVMSAPEVEQRLRGAQLPAILCGVVSLLLAEAPDVATAIDGLGGIVVDPDDRDMVSSAEKEIASMGGTRASPGGERVVGCIPAQGAFVWILSRVAREAQGLDLNERIASLAARILEARPRWEIRVVIGIDPPLESQRAAFAFAERVLQSQRSVMAGLFELVLDAGELNEMMKSGSLALIA